MALIFDAFLLLDLPSDVFSLCRRCLPYLCAARTWNVESMTLWSIKRTTHVSVYPASILRKVSGLCVRPSVFAEIICEGPVPKFLMELAELRGFGRGGGGSSESFMSDHETLNREQVVVLLICACHIITSGGRQVARLQNSRTVPPERTEQHHPLSFTLEKEIHPSMTNKVYSF